MKEKLILIVLALFHLVVDAYNDLDKRLSPSPDQEEVTPEVVEFDVSNANPVPPENIFEEINYYGAGGSPIGDLCEDTELRMDLSYKNNQIILLHLSGFAPEESISLYCYYQGVVDNVVVGEFAGWQEFKVDQQGQLKIIPEENCTYIAVGALSGEVHACSSEGLHSSILAASCGGLLSRLNPIVERRARVAYTNGANMRIRTSPGFKQEILTTVPEGTEINILTLKPECADNSIWWKIRTEDGLEGWMAEEQDGVYLLAPYP